eukprot:XP_001709282.1 Hypothetical protein GL50803_31661 [Giardia lamblia ATCC 50803]
MRARTILASPFLAAHISAVYPLLSVCLASCTAKASTISGWLSFAARMRAVSWFSLRKPLKDLADAATSFAFPSETAENQLSESLILNILNFPHWRNLMDFLTRETLKLCMQLLHSRICAQRTTE